MYPKIQHFFEKRKTHLTLVVVELLGGGGAVVGEWISYFIRLLILFLFE
jgi:hypothetical protein